MKRFGFALVFAMAFFSLAFTVYFRVSGQHSEHGSKAVKGPNSSATVSFGAWTTNPPLDRFFVPAPPPGVGNLHALVPEIAKIKAGGTVNFIIAGLHVVAVYDDGTKPTDINTSILVPGPRPGPPIINDSNRRIYRGIDPLVSAGPPPVFNVDRVEVVQFENPGTYLVICAVLPHFSEGMFGYVRVLPNDEGVATE